MVPPESLMNRSVHRLEVRLAPKKAFVRIAVALVVMPALATANLAIAQTKGLNSALPLVHVENGANSTQTQSQHYVVMVSLDGFRWDYAKRDNASHLLTLAKQGAWAPEGMLPSYPSATYPNHITIVTGLYPEHHGIVDNRFFDPDRQKSYRAFEPEAVKDGTWYGGTPLWSLAESQGMRTACFFWPGSEAQIAGYRPTWYAESNPKTEDSPEVQQARINNAIALLLMPAEQRPHLILMHYSAPDDEGHEYGPDAPQTRAAVLKLDALIGKLKAALDTTGLPIDLVVVSDHGMAHVPNEWITLDQFADLTGFDAEGSLLYGKFEADRERVYNQLKKASSQFMVFRRKNVPAELNYNQNAREGDPVIIATGAYAIRAHAPAAGTPDTAPHPGLHGFDPRKVPEMKAIFIAAGPDIVKGKVVGPFENVNLYPWLAHMLGLAPAKNDGNINILAGTLRDDGDNPDDDAAK
jgi:predicted AlkP superfamily pyrophosphatase or phosphodiesterase